MGRGTLLLAGALLGILALGLDPAGRASHAGGPARGGPVPHPGPLDAVVTAPAGRYELLVRTFAGGEIARIEATAGGRSFVREHVASAVQHGTTEVAVGALRHAGGALAVHVTSSTVGGKLLAVVLRPQSVPGLSEDALQRAAAAAGIALLFLGAGPPLARRPALVAAAVAALLLLPVVIFGRVPFGARDMRGQFQPWHELSAREIAAGRIPLWNPHQLLGLPHLANVQTQVLFPPVLLLLLAGRGYLERTLLCSILANLLAATGMARLARLAGASRPAAAVAGLLYALGPSVQRIGVDVMALVAALLPWLLAAILRRRWRELAAGVALALLAGHPQLLSYAVVGALAIAVSMGGGSGDHGGRARLARVAATGGAIFLGLLLAAVLAVPFLELGAHSSRSRGLAPGHARMGALTPAHLLDALATGWSERALPAEGGIRIASALLVGLWGLPLAAAGLAELGRRRGRARVLPFVALATVGLALGLEVPADLARWRAALPVLDSQRGAARALLLTQAGLSVIAALGLDRLRCGARRRAALAAPVALALGAVASGAALALLAGKRAALAGAPWHVGALAVAAVLLAAPSPRARRVGPILVLALVAAERLDDALGMRPHAFPSAYALHPRGRPPGPGLRQLDVAGAAANQAILTRRRSPYGYDPVVPRRVAELWDLLARGTFPFDPEGRLGLGRAAPKAADLTATSLELLARMGTASILVPPAKAAAVEALAAGADALLRPTHGARELVLRRASRAALVARPVPARSDREALRRLGASDLQVVSGELDLPPSGRREIVVAPGPSPEGIVVESFLAHGLSIPQATTVATLRLEGADGAALAELPLRAGIETADTMRDDPAGGRAAHEAPPVSRSWKVTHEGARFSVHAYRARLPAPEGAEIARIVLERGEGTHLFHVSSIAFEGRGGPIVDVVELPAGTDAAPAAHATSGASRLPLDVEDLSPLHVRVVLPPGHGGGTAIVADTFAPGWVATVDGRPREIHAADVALRAVDVRPGERILEMRYLPFSYRLGLFVSGAAGALWLAAGVAAAGRGSPRRRPERRVASIP